MPIERAFNRTSEYYDVWMKQALPRYEELFSTAVELMAFPAEAELRVLDLGAGTGLFSERVLQKFPRASFVLYDVAEELLELARSRFSQHGQRFEFVLEDYMSVRASDAFDLVISSLSIHHLEHASKRDLFSRIFRALRPEGIFVNVDQIRAETERLRELYWSDWLEKVRQSGAEEERIQESVERRRRYDRDASLAEQLGWLKGAGFADVDCVYKRYFVGVFLAKKG
jgi:tRNA (cmo5U34)-methyltransferase